MGPTGPADAADDPRVMRVLGVLARHRATMPLGDALCASAVEVLGVEGASLTLQPPTTTQSTPIGAWGEHAAHLDEVERTVGEGPCLEASATAAPVSEPDLASTTRWPAFATAMLATPVRAVFGYPLRVEDLVLGALNLYRTEPLALDPDQHLDAQAITRVAVTAVLSAIGSGGDPNVDLFKVDAADLVVHQAAGMAAVQLGTSVAAALLRLRAHAYAEGRALSEVATDIVERRLRLDR